MQDITGFRSRRWPWIALFCTLTATFLALGYTYYRTEIGAIKDHQYDDLHAITALKITQIRAWRNARIAGLKVLVESPYFRDAVTDFVRNPHSKDTESLLRQQLELVNSEYAYNDVMLVDTGGGILLSLNHESSPADLDPISRLTVEDALRSRGAVFGDFNLCSVCGRIHIDAAAPVVGKDDAPVAVLVFRIDPQTLLYPLVQSWPTPRKSAETFLVRKDGDNVLYLNDLLFSLNSAMRLREPLTKTDVPAVKAVLGTQGYFEGKDYRGVEVLADLQPIPNSPWFMVSKVDLDEITAKTHWEAWGVSLFVALLIIISGVGTGLIFVSRQRAMYADLFLAEKALQESEKRYRELWEKTPAMMLSLDSKARIVYVSDLFCESLGYERDEVLTLSPFEFQTEESGRHAQSSVFPSFLRTGSVKDEPLQLVKKNGGIIDVLLNVTAERDSEGSIVHSRSVLVDVTERNLADKALRESESQFVAAFRNSPVAIIITSAIDGKYVDVNDVFVRDTGFTRDEIIGRALRKNWGFLPTMTTVSGCFRRFVHRDMLMAWKSVSGLNLGKF